MKKWKQYLQAISPFNNRTDMPDVPFVLKKTLAFWLCYIIGLFVAEGIAILLHFALGKNVFAGEMLDAQTIMPITYYDSASWQGRHCSIGNGSRKSPSPKWG
jgi:hypothetical protein